MNGEIVFERKNRNSKKYLILGIIALIMFFAWIFDLIFDFVPVPEDGNGFLGELIIIVWIFSSFSWLFLLPLYYTHKSDITIYKDGKFIIKSEKLDNGDYLTLKQEDIVNIIMKYNKDNKLYAIEIQFKDNEYVDTPIIRLNDQYTNYEMLWNILDLSENNSLVKKQTISDSLFNTEIDLRKSKNDPSSIIKIYLDLESGYGDISYDLEIDGNKFKVEYEHLFTINLNNGTHTFKLINYFLGQTSGQEVTINVDGDGFYAFNQAFFNKKNVNLKKYDVKDTNEYIKRKKRKNRWIIVFWILVIILLNII